MKESTRDEVLEEAARAVGLIAPTDWVLGWPVHKTARAVLTEAVAAIRALKTNKG